MQLPANSDQPATALVRRNAVLARHPRIAAMVWFVVCGFTAGLLVGIAISARAVDSMLERALPGGIWGGLAAALPGALFGRNIFDASKVKTIGGATKCGAKVVALSHIMLGLIAGAVALYQDGGAHFVSHALGVFLGLGIGGFVAGIITFPVGCIGAGVLFRIRDWSMAPKGCAVHGYREVGTDHLPASSETEA